MADTGAGATCVRPFCREWTLVLVISSSPAEELNGNVAPPSLNLQMAP